MDINHLIITAGQVTPEILALFDLSKPTIPRAFNVLEGVNRGHILVDDLVHPTWATVRDSVYGTLYFGGQMNAFLLVSLVNHFREIGEVGIGCWLNDPLGVVILDGYTVVCEAATGAPTHERIEVGVTTAELYRGQGFATIACARLIEMCEAQGFRTWWDCAKQNIPSIKLARKLGYQNEREYRYVWWSKNPSGS